MLKKSALKVLAGLIALLVLLSSMPVMSASAATTGTTTEGLEYSIENGEVTITEYICDTAELAILDTIEGYPVTSIGSSAFGYCTSLASVTIPDSVTSIGSSAFRGCTSLTSVIIPNSVTSIGDYAFSGCKSLASITIPDSVTSIGGYAFSGCTSLAKITVDANNPVYDSRESLNAIIETTTNTLIQGCSTTIIPDSVTSIGDYAFSGYTSLSSITIPDSVTSIGWYAFGDCTSLTSVTIPDSVVWIGKYAFNNTAYYNNISNWDDGVLYLNKALIEVDTVFNDGCYKIKEGTKVIADCAFENCISLTSVTIPGSVTSIGSGAFDYCKSLENVYITDIASWCNIDFGNYYSNPLYYADNLYFNNELVKEVVIPEGVAEIPIYAFSCTSLESIAIPDSVTSIGNYAFEDCTSLASVTIPDSVTSIGNYAFEDCRSLASVTIPNSVTSIGGSAFEDCTSLASVTIPDSVTSIDGHAFWGCTSLTSVTIPDSVTSIGGHAFWYCTSLVSVTIPDSVTSIDESAFRRCTSLASVTIPDSVTSIGDHAFEGCKSLENVYITDIASWCNINFMSSDSNPLSYADNLYFNNELVKEIVIPEGVTEIPINAFSFTSLESVTIPDSVTSIGDYAFSGCKSLASITIPDSVTSIGDRAFWYCTSLAKITVDANNPVYDSRESLNAIIETTTNTLIQGCSTTIIPDSVTSIGDYAFSGYTSLSSITIPDSVTSIGWYAFGDCTSLTSVTIPDSVTSIGGDAFLYCTSLADVYYSGTESQWNAIKIGMYNEGLINATIHFGSTGPTIATEPSQVTTVAPDTEPSTEASTISTDPVEPTAPANVLTDEKTQISVETDKDTDAQLKVVEITDSKQIEEINFILTGERVGKLYDITLDKDGVTIQPDGSVTVRITAYNDKCNVYRVEEDGTLTNMNAEYKDGYFVFTTEYFRLFIVAEKLADDTTAPTDPLSVLGDVNGDGKLNIRDATAIQKYVAKMIEFGETQFKLADFNADGKINVKDATQIQKKIAGLI